MKISKLLVLFLLACSCQNPPKATTTKADCEKIIIKNRWSRMNQGMRYLEVKKQSDLDFICNRVMNFPKGKRVMVSYAYGYLELFVGNRTIDIIFTVHNGIVFAKDIGEYVYDDELAARIKKLMYIKSNKWQTSSY